MAWTDDQVEELRRLWVEDTLPSTEIARRLGISREAVMGKINRLGLLRHCSPPTLLQLSRSTEQLEEPAAALPAAPSTADHRATESTASSPIGKHPTIFELRAGQCRFPLGARNEPAAFFCGKPALAPKPYCRECCQQAYITPRPR